MDAFIFLQMEHERIEQQLDEFCGSSAQMTKVKKFERISLIFEEIKRHFAHHESLLVRSSYEVTDFAKQCSMDRNSIIDAMDNLLMSHVDEPDFNEGLRKLMAQFDTHLKHHNEKLFVSFREQLSEQEIRNMDSQATDWMLGSSYGSRF